VSPLRFVLLDINVLSESSSVSIATMIIYALPSSTSSSKTKDIVKLLSLCSNDWWWFQRCM